ncbi:MAG: DNA primase small subunit domain-containing protein [Candidatus Njordarchaeia archaeon]
MNGRARDRILLLLAIKPERKTVDFEHIYEKVSRDSGASKDEITKELNNLITEGLVEKVGEKYKVTPQGRKEAWMLVDDPEMNLSYRLILKARDYYPKIAPYILPYLVNRPVSVIKIFSDEKDPINKVKPIFSRYKKFKPKQYNYIKNAKDLMRYVDMHAIDFIPYVHREKNNYPDWLIVDLDAGDEIKNAGEIGFNLVKEITKIATDVMKDEFNLKPCVKFSGSRGFQIWVTFQKPLGTFETYRNAVVIIQRKVEEIIEKNHFDELKDKYGDLIGKPLTTSTVAKKKERSKQILFDWSSLKPEGDVRAPFSIHYKTGLISSPVQLNDILKFEIEQADFRNVLNHAKDLYEAFKLEPSPVEALDKELKRFSLLSFA